MPPTRVSLEIGLGRSGVQLCTLNALILGIFNTKPIGLGEENIAACRIQEEASTGPSPFWFVKVS